MIRARVVSTRSELRDLREALGCPPVEPGSTLLLDRVVGQGGTATVYAASVVGATGTPVLVKRCDHSLGERALRFIGEMHTVLDAHLDRDWTVYAAGLPFWVGELDEGNGQPGAAMVMADLTGLGFVSLDAVLDSGGDELFALPLVERMALALAFAEGQAFWDQVGFVHADINPPNIFVDLSGRRAVCIDFDMGALAGSASCGLPLARGKPDEFRAPEVAAGAEPGPMSDNWATGIALGYLLLGCHPLFFLEHLSPPLVARYLAEQGWPNLDKSADLVNLSAVDLYDEWRDELDQLPADIVDAFADLVAGFADPPRRPAPIAWAFSLHPSLPTFAYTEATELVLAGEPVNVSWSARSATTVSVAGCNGLPARGSLAFTPVRSGKVDLQAANLFGHVDVSLEFVVARLPGAPPLDLVAPRFSASTMGRPPVVPRWGVPVTPLARPAPRWRSPVVPSWSVTSS